MKTHELKTDQDVFQAVIEGLKRYEIRRDDRGFSVGDELLLRETEYTGVEMQQGKPLLFTGREELVQVIHILKGPVYGLIEGWVIMSIVEV